MIVREAYSYRNDPSVPHFPDGAPIVVYDGVCVLCSGWVGFLLKRDPDVCFAAAQSHLAQALFRHYGLDPEEFETWILLEHGRAHVKAEGIARMLSRWGGVWAALGWLVMATPRRLRNWLYHRIARNRYRIFGRRDACMIPSEEDRARFLAWD